MKPNPSLRTLFALSGSALFLVTQVNAATYYWDSNSTTAGLGDTAGTWGSSAFWGSMNGGSSRIIINGTQTTANTTILAADTVYFGTVDMTLGSTASTIGIAVGGVTANRIVFGAGQGSQGVTLSGGGGTITLGSTTPSIYANNTGTNTIGAVLNGTAGLVYGGSGTTRLTGANGFTGGVTVTSGGTLQIGDGTSGSLTSQALTFHTGGGVFNVRSANTGSTQAMGALTFTNTGTTSGEGTVQSTYGTSGNAELSFSSLAARGAGATGNFIISGGTNGTTNKIVITGAATGFLDKGLYFNGSSYAAYDSGGYVRALAYGTDTDAEVADTITASKHVQLTSSPAARAGDTLLSLNLSGGGVDYTMNSGSLTVPAILKSGGGAVSTISGGTSLTTASNAELVIRTDTSSDFLTISSLVTGFSGGLTKTGEGTLTLSNGANAYTGATRINAGILAVSGGNAITDGQAVILANAAGATLQLNSNETILNVTGGGFSGGNVNVQGNTLTLSSTGNYAFGGQFTGTSSGGVIKQGAGTLTLSNKNTFAGSITLEGGILSFTYGNDGTGTLIALSSGGAINMANSTTLNINPTANLPAGVIGSQLQAVNGGSPAFPYGFTVANDINIASGTSTANITIAGNENSVRFTGNVTGGATGNQTLAITTGNATDRQVVAFSGVIADGSSGTLGLSATLRAANNGAYVNLTNNNTFSGPISVTTTNNAPGYLVIGGERYGTAATLVTGSGSLGIGGVYSGTISLTNTGAGVSILSYASSANQTLAGNISGTNGRLLKDGSGTLTLSGTNSYTGGTTVSTGAFVFRNTGAKSGTGTHAFAAGTTLGLGVATSGSFFTATDVTNAFAGTMTGNLSNVTVTATTNLGIDTTAGNFTYSDNITGSPTKGLTKLGANSLILEGANTYTGTTAVNEGTLLVNGSLGNTAVTVNGGAFGGSGSIGSILTITSGSFHVVDINDALQVTGLVTLYAGFGVDDLTGITWGSVSNNTYTLINGTLDTGVFAGLANNSLGTAYDIGGGRSAYFQEGSLQLVVIPEPRALLLGSLGILLLLRRRR